MRSGEQVQDLERLPQRLDGPLSRWDKAMTEVHSAAPNAETSTRGAFDRELTSLLAMSERAAR
jgi:hypothetical protein